MRRVYILLFTLFPLLTLSAQTYYLPKTVVRFHLQLERQTYQPGDFARYAERYLRLTGVNQQEVVSHRVVDCVVSTIGVRDTSKCFVAQLKGKSEKADLRLSGDGVLLAVNDEALPTPPERGFQQSWITHKAAPSAKSVLSAEALAAGSTAKMAEITAQQILDLREQRQLLATGEADNMPQDEQQLQLMLRRIDQQHDQLMALFVGTTTRDTLEKVVTFCPTLEQQERQVLFRLSHRLGIVDADDLTGVPYYIIVKNLYPVEQPLFDNKKGEHLCANVPGMARLTLLQEDVTLAQFDIPVAQFGIVELRDANLFKRNTVHLQLHPATGAVLKMLCEEKR